MQPSVKAFSGIVSLSWHVYQYVYQYKQAGRMNSIQELDLIPRLGQAFGEPVLGERYSPEGRTYYTSQVREDLAPSN